MNSLSWLLYLSGVVGSINSFLIFVTVAFGAGSVITGAIFIITRIVASETHRKQDERADNLALSNSFRKFFIIFITLFTVVGCIANLVPDRRTMIMIASSEVGEKVINSEGVQKVIDPSIDLLKTYMEKEMLSVQKEIKRLKGDDK